MSGEHVMPIRVYLAVIATLMVLTVVTVWVAFLDFGFLNDVIAVGIAVFKAFLVAVYFMHLRFAAPITRLCAGAGVIFFVIMIALTLSDYRSRAWLPFPEGWETTVETTVHH
ncbi:MAG: cytochrome C oxidase subunit IV family protein [Kiritimatiellae bacterium]|nr:cytochrome C oxidase subunit IV family protein [Kiritimatiellia bacterium]MDW8459093.1 cytochrome C oxidase subunit IV family protein [Verrucomicrobiota bacterium]